MDKNAIKKYAVWARNELLEKVTQKALQYGIEEGKELDSKLDSINGVLLTEVEKKQRQALIQKIENDGFSQVMEEVAYTWFNRFIAIRFMEINGYLPSHVRVFSDDCNTFRPQILSEALHLEIEDIDTAKVMELKSLNKDDELYKYLLIAQCNSLSGILPGMFQKINDYTELLLPDYLLREGSVIEQLVTQIDADNFDVSNEKGQIEVIGWFYQYYNDEKKADVIDMAGKTAISKSDIPAATQLFTTDWVVRYIVDNTLGHTWINNYPESGLRNNLEMYIEEIPKYDVEKKLTPQDLTFFDPCIGSGHFAIYAFEVLLKIYVEYGYSERDAVVEIIENNIYGLDIDERAAQLAYFSIMMKARQYDRRFFTRGIYPHIRSIAESNRVSENVIEHFCHNNEMLKKDINKIINGLKDAKEYGSLLVIENIDFNYIHNRVEQIIEANDLYSIMVKEELLPVIETAEILSKKYMIVDTNPPYLNKFNDQLKSFLNNTYKDYSSDLFSAFMYRNFDFCEKDGCVGFMTPFVWMFIKSYEKLRGFIIGEKNITSLIQMEYSAYEEATVPICAFTMQNRSSSDKGVYLKLSDFKGGMKVQEEKTLEAINSDECEYKYLTSKEDLKKIPGSPIAFWLSERLLQTFSNSKLLGEYGDSKVGLQTGDTNRFLRYWTEIDIQKTYINNNDSHDNYKWFPICKGGEYRRWYGNNDYVVNWENDGYEIKNFKNDKGKLKSRPQNTDYYFKKGITWNLISSSNFAVRCYPEGMIFDVSANSFFCEDYLYKYIAAVLNSKISFKLSQILNPTINFSAGVVANLPIAIDETKIDEINGIVSKCIEIEKADWDSFEWSWDFKRHPLAQGNSIEKEFEKWTNQCNDRFSCMRENEQRINEIFIDVYGLEGEMTADVSDKDVTIKLADKTRDIKSLISYAVGCMFGRYSLDVPGLAYAGGEWDATKYTTFKPDEDAIIPICDDEYFDDDIVGKFIQFVEVVYGKDTLEENLQFIADALGGKGSSREVIRNYFINDFYADHVKIYQKRPIYWLFDSGKKNGFKCLIYMHRYQPDTIARIRTDYVHEQQARYRTAIEETEKRIESATGSDKVKLTKKLNTLKAQDDEIHAYEEKIHHLADQMISIDLDDGVKHNYEIFKDVLAKIK